MNIGFYTTFELPSKRGNCNWYGCGEAVSKCGFCEEHGKVEVTVTISNKDSEELADEFGFNKYTNNTHKKKNI